MSVSINANRLSTLQESHNLNRSGVAMQFVREGTMDYRRIVSNIYISLIYQRVVNSCVMIIHSSNDGFRFSPPGELDQHMA